MPPTQQPECLFFARVADPDLLTLIEFYREDIETIRSLGYVVTTITQNRKVLRAARPTIAFCWWHSTALPTVILMRLRRIPVVVTGATHFQDADARSLRNTLRILVSRITARLATMNIAISEFELADFDFLPSSRRTAVRLSVDTDYYSPGTHVNAGSAITVAQLNPNSIRRKGVDVAILAVPLIAQRVQNFHLHIVGRPSQDGLALLNELLDRSDRSRITIHGEVDRDEKRELLRGSEIYVQMSSFEGFGLAAVEALACGVPVIHSGHGSLNEVIGTAGIRAADRSPEALADATVALLARLSSDRTLRSTARNQALSLSRSVRKARLGDVMNKLIG